MPQPPDRELRAAEQGAAAGNRHAVIRADRRGQAALAKELLEGGDCGVLAGRLEALAQQQEARGVVGDDQAFDLGRQLVGVAHRPARAVAERLESVLLVAREDLVARLAGDAELAAQLRHRSALAQPGNESQALVRDRTLGIAASRRKAESVTHVSGTSCHLCVGPLNALAWAVNDLASLQPGAESASLTSHWSGRGAQALEARRWNVGFLYGGTYANAAFRGA